MRLALALALALAFALVAGCLGTDQNPNATTPPTTGPNFCGPSVSAPSADLEAPPAPRLARFPTGDGVVLSAVWRAGANGSVHSGWTLVLLHEYEKDHRTWDAFGLCAASRGYNVLEVDLRGHGNSTTRTNGSTISWTTFKASDLENFRIDAFTAENLLVARFNVSTARLVVLGADVGANVALWAAVDNPRLAGAGALSPSLHSPALDADAAVDHLLGNKTSTRFLLAGSTDDPRSADAPAHLVTRLGSDRATLATYEHVGHGTAMFSETDLAARVLGWLGTVETGQR